MSEHPFDERSLPITGSGRDERLAGKDFDGDFFVTGKRVRRRNGEKDIFPEQLYRAKRWSFQGLRSETEVDFAGPELLGHDRRRTLIEPKASLRVLFEILGSEAGQNAQRFGSDSNAAPRAPGGIVELLVGLIDFVQGAGYPDQERGAESVEHHAPSATIEEGNAKVGLETRNNPAKSRLGNAELIGRAADMLMASHGLEVAQL